MVGAGGQRLSGVSSGRRSVSMPKTGGFGILSGGRGGQRSSTSYGVPRGTIKSYWSKKVKNLAKSMVRQHGPDEGIARTRSIANEVGWKMQ